MRRLVLGVGATAIVACGPSVQTARLHAEGPTLPREARAQKRADESRCQGSLAWFFPGLGQYCHHKDGEAIVLSTLAAVEGGTALGVGARQENSRAAFRHPGVALPLIGLQNLWIYGLADVGIDNALAARRPFAAQDTLTELAVAPFNGRVLSRPDVLGGIFGFSLVGIGALALLGGYDVAPAKPSDVNYFGQRLSPGVGYPLAGATFGAVFTHVAIGEEALFRGYIQSGLARSMGETGGWAAASAIFAAAHVPNVLAFNHSEDRIRFLTIGLPVITAGGAFLGWSYRHNDYSLAPPVAIHFWYDFIVSAVAFAVRPDDSVLAARITLPLPF